jgi:uncharacterized protein
MHWLNEPAHWQSLEHGLEIVTDANTDFWQVTHYGFTPDNGHAYFETMTGDFMASVQFDGDYSELYDQAGLMLRVDAQHWIKTGIELEDNQYCMSAVVTRDFSDWSIVPLLEKPALVWLRLLRQGDSVKIEYSLDGTTFLMLRLAYFPTTNPVQIGMMACSPKRAGFKASFKNFKLEQLA